MIVYVYLPDVQARAVVDVFLGEDDAQAVVTHAEAANDAMEYVRDLSAGALAAPMLTAIQDAAIAVAARGGNSVTLTTVEHVARRVAQVAAFAADLDAESAHEHEDALHAHVLTAIARRACVDPVACAQEAVKTVDLEFPRGCA